MTPETPPPDAGAEPPRKPRRIQILRLVALAVVLVGIVVVARATGLSEQISVESLRAWMEGAGLLGIGVFVAVFCLGELIHIPGMVFVAAAILAYGRLQGGALSYLAALVSVSVSFWVVRLVGGKPLAALKHRIFQRILAKLDNRPVLTVALLRMVFWLTPALNYALALSSLRFRDYLLGSALGLVLPIALAALLFEWAVALLL